MRIERHATPSLESKGGIGIKTKNQVQTHAFKRIWRLTKWNTLSHNERCDNERSKTR
jgi:hypothetical protein